VLATLYWPAAVLLMAWAQGLLMLRELELLN